MIHPTLTIIAGANGAGKSTVTGGNPNIFDPKTVLDPDAIAKTIQSKARGPSAIAAGRQVLKMATHNLERSQSFAIETTLSGQNYLRMMVNARDLGFEIELIYIGTEAVEINLARIVKRVSTGGHDVPEVDVRRRYQRSLGNLPLAIARADRVLIFDNSQAGPRIVGVMEEGEREWFEPVPAWAAFLRA